MRATTSALVFEGAARATVTLLKDAHELRLAPVMAAAIACALDEASAWPARDGAARHSDVDVDAICFVPATPAAYARRGFDHMELVSRELSTLVSIPLADVLARVDASDQRTLGRQGRADNARGTFRVVDDVGGMDLLLVDDVVTTGASMREAARTLLGRGASSVSAASFARVW
jgi:ComF family protein